MCFEYFQQNDYSGVYIRALFGETISRFSSSDHQQKQKQHQQHQQQTRVSSSGTNKSNTDHYIYLYTSKSNISTSQDGLLHVRLQVQVQQDANGGKEVLQGLQGPLQFRLVVFLKDLAIFSCR